MKAVNDTDRPFPNPGASRRAKDCGRIGRRFRAALCRGLGPEAAWVQRHLAECPRCRRRVAAWHKVDLALRVVKSQPHRLDLLREANTSTLKMLKHELRDAPQARVLADSRPEPSFLERSGKYRHWAANVAACFAILFLAKSGLFSSLDRLNTGGAEFVRQYYANQAGEDLAKEIFDA